MISTREIVVPAFILLLLNEAWKSHAGFTEHDEPELFSSCEYDNEWERSPVVFTSQVEEGATSVSKSKIGSPGTYPKMVNNISAGSFTVAI